MIGVIGVWEGDRSDRSVGGLLGGNWKEWLGPGCSM